VIFDEIVIHGCAACVGWQVMVIVELVADVVVWVCMHGVSLRRLVS
jgi:hypothetical protein